MPAAPVFKGDPNVDYNKVPQRFHKYPASDRAKKIVHEAITMDALFGCGWPLQWSSPEGPEFHDVMAHMHDAGCDHAAGHCTADHDHSDHSDHLAVDGFTSVSFVADRPLSLEKLQDFLANRLPVGVLRAKGILWFAGSDRRHILHITGKRLSMERGEWSTERKNRLVFIGRDLNHENLRTELQASMVRNFNS